jgi:LysR family transcriptional regulator, low CO2-responsive transcriptional regulator
VTTNARLRVFVQLAECGSVRAAAEALVVTESSVSAAVTALARDVGVALIERDGRGVRLTPAGERYAEYARRILGLHAEAVAAARSESGPEHGLVRLAAVTTAGEHVLPDLLASFRDEHPGVDMRLEVGSRDAVWPMLVHHEVDLVVAGRPPADLAVAVRATSPNTLVVVGSPRHREGFAPNRATWLLREQGSGTRSTCLGVLSALEADPPQLTLGSQGATVAAAAAGLGVTLVSEQAVAAHVRAGRLVVLPVPGTPLERPWHLVSGTRATASAELLVAHVRRRPEWAAGG